ncbi:Tir3p KNAG_0G01030 [Huiozyma naganishii CBS 8797]|uniref:Temperature shock-inducible protein 1 n=1 Tax=Huiozyma naganishii (strain ATCC MYA-139 / BCRC 22969 / CBS 8797 / KCTC 17520 / NBRC 10181 / NCYC 3082 / Yp74L-3) TaxID=1071383 RepID=J7S8X3_HUIN7|nr:hypothetical protein KNAG_0G01030 [Kazachstania naganishii CBS 8797]CCK71161.1 hypothetical protein KNAG_0G01030 [Kazachstania naganishii CBS 8797]
MSIAKISALLATVASLAAAINDYEVAEFNAILVDVKANLMQYISLAENNPDFTLPDGVLDVYTQLTTYTDESYTSLFTAIDFDQVTTVMHQVPWYSSRLIPIMSSYMAAHSITETADPAVNGAATTGADSATASATASAVSSAASSAASSVSSEESSSRASSSSVASSAASSSSSAASSAASSVSSAASSAASSVSSAASSSSRASSSRAAAANVNAFSAGVGAVVAGAAALLL